MKTKTEAEQLLETINAHPLTQKILEEKAAAILEERRMVAGLLRAATEEAERVIPERQQEVDALVAHLAEYDEGRKAILDRLTAARGELMKERQRFDREWSDAEAALFLNYDPRIDMAILFFRDRFEVLRVKDINTQTRAGERNLFTETKQVLTYSNAGAIQAALSYCRAAIDELERMKLTPELNTDRVYELRAKIPDPDTLTESAGEKPLPGSKGFNPLRIFKSEDQQNWELGKIAEKFKKVMTGK